MSVTGLEEREARAAAAGGSIKRSYVRRMFSEIAPRYDLLNHLLSFNVDRRWRARAIARLGLRRRPHGFYVDLCAGTLDVGALITHAPEFGGLVVGADFAEPMLRHGEGKAPRDRLAPVAADALALPLRDGTASGVIVAFGIRNVTDLDDALREAHRILEPGGRLVILECSTPRARVVRRFYHVYFRHLLPRVARAVSGHRTAYRYLPDSVAAFPTEEQLAVRMLRAGFVDVEWESLTAGIAAIHWGEKRPEQGSGHAGNGR